MDKNTKRIIRFEGYILIIGYGNRNKSNRNKFKNQIK